MRRHFGTGGEGGGGRGGGGGGGGGIESRSNQSDWNGKRKRNQRNIYINSIQFHETFKSIQHRPNRYDAGNVP